MKKVCFRFVVCALAMIVASQAGALTTGYVYAHYENASPSSIVSYSLNGGSWTSVYAGVYNLHIQATPGRYGNYTAAKEATALINSGTPFDHGNGEMAISVQAFCIDIYQTAPKNNEWNFYEIRTLDNAPGGAPGSLFMTDQAMNDITKLWYNYSGILDQGTAAEKNFAAGVFQVCIWEIVNERNGNYDLANGDFRINNLAMATTGNSWLTSLSSLPDVPESELQLRALYSDLWQDFAVVMPVKPPGTVPEPLTMAGLGMAIFGAGAYLRKRGVASKKG